MAGGARLQAVPLVVREAGADLEFDCATGRMEEPMTFSADGTFDVDGTFTPGVGGPVREDDPPIPEAARYMGVLRGDRLTLSAILVEDGTTIGPYFVEVRSLSCGGVCSEVGPRGAWQAHRRSGTANRTAAQKQGAASRIHSWAFPSFPSSIRATSQAPNFR